GGVSAIKELMTKTTLALSAAMRLGIEEIEPFGRVLAGMSSLGVRPARRETRLWISTRRGAARLTEQLFAEFQNSELQPTLFDDSGIEFDDPRKTDYHAALALLKHADLGIDGVEIVNEGEPFELGALRRTVKLLHRVGERRIPLDMSDES